MKKWFKTLTPADRDIIIIGIILILLTIIIELYI